MRKMALTSGLSAIAVALALVAASPAKAQYGYGWYGQGMMGPGMMGPGMMGSGMMGHMMGPGMMMGQGWCPGCGTMGPGMMGPGMMGMMGPGMMGPGMMMGQGYQPTNLNLSVNDVKGYLERWIAMTGNSRIKVGSVTEKDSSTITADIVTTDKEALVQRFAVDRSAGIYRPVQ